MRREAREPTTFTTTDKDATLCALLHRMERLEEVNQALHNQVKFVHHENNILKEQYRRLEEATMESIAKCALLPEAPLWEYIDNTAACESKVRGLTVFELQQLYSKINKIKSSDPALQQLAKITNTTPGVDNTYTFKPVQWTAHVQWCAYYYLFFGHLKKGSKQHTRVRRAEHVIDDHDASTIAGVHVEHFEFGDAVDAVANVANTATIPACTVGKLPDSPASDSGAMAGRESKKRNNDDDFMSDSDDEGAKRRRWKLGEYNNEYSF